MDIDLWKSPKKNWEFLLVWCPEFEVGASLPVPRTAAWRLRAATLEDYREILGLSRELGGPWDPLGFPGIPWAPERDGKRLGNSDIDAQMRTMVLEYIIFTYIRTPKITQLCRNIFQHHGSHLGWGKPRFCWLIYRKCGWIYYGLAAQHNYI